MEQTVQYGYCSAVPCADSDQMSDMCTKNLTQGIYQAEIVTSEQEEI